MNIRDCKKIVLTGGSGFLGKHVYQGLLARGVAKERIFIPRSSSYDLRVYEKALEATRGADLLIHLAAKVGGIGYNQKRPAEMFFDNASMGINLIEASRKNDVKKVVVVGTICAYPKHTPVPFREEDLWNGYPEETNAPYGIAKKSLAVMLDGYHRQYGMNGVFLLPVNLYGPEDNFDLEASHVIPAMIRKFHAAKTEGAAQVVLWGDGSPTREFLYVKDAAEGILLATEKYESTDPVNIGTAEEISIKGLAELISRKIGFEGKIVWDTNRPNGQERRKLNIEKAKASFGFEAKTHLSEGLDETIQWWKTRGVNSTL